MSVVLSLSFTDTVAQPTGAWPVSVAPATVQGDALSAPLSVPGYGQPFTHGWRPDATSTLSVDLTKARPAYGELALDVWIAGVDPTGPGALVSGGGSPVHLSLAPSAKAHTFTLTAVIATSGTPVVLIGEVARPTTRGDILAVGVWLSGSDAVLTVSGTTVTRRRLNRSVPDAEGELRLGAAPAVDPGGEDLQAAEAMIVAIRLTDEVSADQEAEMSRAAGEGIGEIDSLVESGAEGFLGLPREDERATGRMRWRLFEHGTAYWSAATSAHVIRGEIGLVHVAKGGVVGRLGLPASAERGLNETLDSLRGPKVGKSGLTVHDVVKKVTQLDRDDLVLEASPARATPGPPRPLSVEDTWDRFRTNDADHALRLDISSLAGTEAGTVVAVSGGQVDAAALVRASSAAGGDYAALVTAQAIARTSWSRGVGRESTVLQVVHEAAGLTDVFQRLDQGLDSRIESNDVETARSVVGIERLGQIDLSAHDVASTAERAASAVVTRRFATHASQAAAADVGTRLADGSLSMLEAAVLAPAGYLAHPTLAPLLDESAPRQADARLLSQAPDELQDLIEESSRLGIELHLAGADRIGYTLAGPRAQLFQTGIVVYTAGHGGIDLYDEIFAHWVLLGGSRGFLGAPLYGETTMVGGAYAEFGGGRIYWSSATGPHEVHGAILARYRTGSTERQLGFPLKDESAVKRHQGARMSSFERGHVFWTSERGALIVTGDHLRHWLDNGGLARYGLPTGEVVTTTSGGTELRQQSFERGLIGWTETVGTFDSMQVRLARVATGSIDDGWELSGWIPSRDVSAELFVKAWVWVDDTEVFHRQTSRGGKAQDLPDWLSPVFALTPSTTVRIRIEAWDMDSTNDPDRLADHDVTLTLGNDFFGYTRAWGSHLGQPSTWNDSGNAGPGAVTFDYTLAPPFEPDLKRMRRDHFWRFGNAGRDHLPWAFYQGSFDDINGDDINYFTDPFDSWYYDQQYKEIADGGNCFGFSVTALDAFELRSGQAQPLSQATSDLRDDAVWQLINRGQGSQAAASVVLWKIACRLDPETCDPRRVWSRVKAVTDTGHPVILSLRGEESGHAVLVHHCDLQPDGTRRMYLADSNLPWTPAWQNDDLSMVVVQPDGSYAVHPTTSYPDYGAGPWMKGTLGRRHLMEIPHGMLTAPLRTPVWDTATAMACLVGGLLTTDGASVSQVESGGRKLVGDQRRAVVTDLRAEAEMVTSVITAGIAMLSTGEPEDDNLDPSAVASRRMVAVRDSSRLAGIATLLAPGAPVDTTASLVEHAAAQLPGAARAQASWGSVHVVAPTWADELVVEIDRHGPLDIEGLMTPGAVPRAALIHLDDDDPDGPDIVAFQGPVPSDLVVTLRGRGRAYRQGMLGRGGLITIACTLAQNTYDTVRAMNLAGERPGFRLTTSGVSKVADVKLAAAGGGTVGPGASFGWSLRLGVGPGAEASVRWMAGRPGLALQHAAAVPDGQMTWGGAARHSYWTPAATVGEVIRVVPHDAASPFGAIRLQRHNVMGDLVATELVDPSG